jgi:Transglutaminase-like superfamily
MLHAIPMSRLRKFLRLPRRERWLLIKAALLLALIRIGLRLLPFKTLKQFLDSVSRVPAGSHRANQFSSDRIVWAVISASRYVLVDKPCLTQALAVQLLLKRRGYPANLRIGVNRTAGKQLEAHAWVESGDRVVVGGGDLSRYTPLPAFDGEQQ